MFYLLIIYFVFSAVYHHVTEQCIRCGSHTEITTRRMNTQYADDEENFNRLCVFCDEEINAMWQERWDDYYASVRSC